MTTETCTCETRSYTKPCPVHGPAGEWYEIGYEMRFDPQDLAEAAGEVRKGIVAVAEKALDPEIYLDPKDVRVEAMDRFEGGELIQGLFLRATMRRRKSTG